jgi:hypothetical protein
VVGRVRSLGILRTGDPALDRVQDHVKQQLDPILQNPLLSAVDFRCIEVQGADPATAPTFALQYRSASTAGGAPSWSTIASWDSTGQIVQPPWIAPTLINGWSNFGAGWQPAGYYRDTSGHVWLRGSVTNAGGTGAGVAMFVLPAAYRPANRTSLNALDMNGTGTVRLDVDSSGNVFPNGVVAAGALYAINGLSFDTRS